MIKNILWKGLNAESLEYCSINYKDVIKVRSSVVGCSGDLPYRTDYEIELDQHWVVRSFLIRNSMSNMDQHISLHHNGNGKWYHENKEWPQLQGCMYIDISVSPFTNTLPINRLRPGLMEQQEIQVVYIDLLEFRIRKERQLYLQLDDNTYRFTNNSGDFTADISVDKDGLVQHYPGLFDRVLLRE